jgi:hypothetical protein
MNDVCIHVKEREDCKIDTTKNRVYPGNVKIVAINKISKLSSKSILSLAVTVRQINA